MSTSPSNSDQSNPVASAEHKNAWTSEGVISHESTRTAQMDKVFSYFKGLHATHLMDLGTKLGLFAQLGNTSTGMTPDALASELRLYPEYVRIWCEAACALELLDYDPATGYRFAPFMKEILGQREGAYYLGSFPSEHLLLARDYARYPELLRTGGVYPYQQHDEKYLRSVAEATRSLPRMFLDAVLPRLPKLQSCLENGSAVLDVGCGGGYALVDFAKRYPNARYVGIDVEPVSIRMAQELIRAHSLNNRVEARLVESTSWSSDFVDTFDVVTTFLVLHEIRPDLKATVLKQCGRVLRPGGQLLLFDERYPSTPAELRDPSQIYAVIAQWYEMMWGNIINTKEEIHALLGEQGLYVTGETSLSRFYIISAEKRAEPHLSG